MADEVARGVFMAVRATNGQTAFTPTPVPPPAGCTVALTGDDAAAFGGVPADILGQEFSMTSVPDTTSRFATSGLATPTEIPSGTRVAECVSAAADPGVLTTFLFLSSDGAAAVTATLVPGDVWQFQAQAPAGSSIGSVSIPVSPLDVVALGVDADTGAAVAWITQEGVTSQVAGGTFGAAAATLFAGKVQFSLAGGLNPFSTGLSAAAAFITAGGVYQDSYGGASDWCGNPI